MGFVLQEPSPTPDAPAARCQQADIDRAIAIAERAGLAAYRIEIAPDGAVAIVVGGPGAQEKPPGGQNRT